MNVKQLILAGFLIVLFFSLIAGALIPQEKSMDSARIGESALIHGGLVHGEPLPIFTDSSSDPVIITPYN